MTDIFIPRDGKEALSASMVRPPVETIAIPENTIDLQSIDTRRSAAPLRRTLSDAHLVCKFGPP
ncbi:hypothetical protein [Aquibium microcysteis]|uniref:hypothetical protein n=1 Tax=Aquibium microcysteis TaxID=675281 RepID=UPI00165CF845|nr:hypothetical protein [Aquibium microcysteis]